MKDSSSVKPRSLVSQTIDAFRERIRSGDWPVGHRLPPENDLASELAVSRNTVREAVRVLSHSKVLDVRQGDGTYVRLRVDPAETIETLHASTLREHLELQCMLEAEAAGLASRRRDERDLRDLKWCLTQRGERRRDERFADFVERDQRFHDVLVRASHNAPLTSLYAFFSATVNARIVGALEETSFAEPGLEAHLAVVRAVEIQDHAAAERAVRALYEPILAQARTIS